MEFLITPHAKKRMLERNVPHPQGLLLKKCGRKIKKRIRESCLKKVMTQRIMFITLIILTLFMYASKKM